MKYEKAGLTFYSPDEPELAGLKKYGEDKILKGEKYCRSVPRWLSGDCGVQMSIIEVADSDIEPCVIMRPYVAGLFSNPPDIDAIKNDALKPVPADVGPVVSLPVLPMETYVNYAIINIADKTMYTEWGDNVDYLRKMFKEHNLDSEKYALVKQTTTSVYDVIK